MKEKDRNMSWAEKAIVVLCVFIAGVVWLGECRAEEERSYDYSLTLMPKSWHHKDDSDAVNEDHNGIGIHAKRTDGFVVGGMYYNNSYDDTGPLIYAGFEDPECSWCVGLIVGIAPAYKESDHEQIVGALTFRYKWVSILTIPSEVTAVVFNIPLNH